MSLSEEASISRVTHQGSPSEEQTPHPAPPRGQLPSVRTTVVTFRAAIGACAAWRAMTRQANWNDLGTVEVIEKKLAAIRDALKAIAELNGVNDAIALVDQLDDAIADIAADVEIGIHERGAQRGR